MQQERKPRREISPDSEDLGLFKHDICQLMVELIPQSRVNDRQDLIIKGFVDRTMEIDVFFAGRRAKDAIPINNRLKMLLAHARKTTSATGSAAPDVEHLRLPVKIEGAWRKRFKRDQTGWETGTYHLVAARWSILDASGNTISYGEPAAKAVKAH